jgi:hypothetical protein
VEITSDMLCLSATASDAKELASNGFKQKLQCTCRDGLGRDALSLAAEAALNDAIDEGYALLAADAAATGGAEGGAATDGAA